MTFLYSATILYSTKLLNSETLLYSVKFLYCIFIEIFTFWDIFLFRDRHFYIQRQFYSQKRFYIQSFINTETFYIQRKIFVSRDPFHESNCQIRKNGGKSWWNLFEVHLQDFLGIFQENWSERLFCWERVSACYYRKELHSWRCHQNFWNIKNTRSWRVIFISVMY